MLLVHRTGPNGKEKKSFFLEWGLCASACHTDFSKHDAILQRIQPWPRKNSNTHLKDENIEKYCETATIQHTKILITGCPQAHFEHLGVQPGSKLHARHDGHSEIIS